MESARKDDSLKTRFDLIPSVALREVADVFTYGAKKYAPDNWRKGMNWSRLYAAAQRHLNTFWSGDSIDYESHLNHIAHACANLLMLLDYYECDEGTDDRPKYPEKGDIYTHHVEVTA